LAAGAQDREPRLGRRPEQLGEELDLVRPRAAERDAEGDDPAVALHLVGVPLAALLDLEAGHAADRLAVVRAAGRRRTRALTGAWRESPLDPGRAPTAEA